MGQSIFTWLFPILIFFFFFLHHDFVYSSPPSLSSSTDKHLTPYTQKLALFQFKLSLGININASLFSCDYHGIPSHPKTMNWSMSSDCCTWDGVTCNDSTGDIIRIDLGCSQLEGSIIPNSTLFHLSQLEALNLAFNDFSGPLPQEFGFFAGNLMHLNLSYGGFYGQISSETFKFLMQNLTQLREISFSGLDISSVLPMNLSTSLRYLDLSETGLHGEIPQEVFHLPHLKALELSYNPNLTGYLPDVK